MLALVLIGAITLIAAETVCTLFFKDRYQEDERNLLYMHHPVLGWFPQENSRSRFKAVRDITIEHNSGGFRDEEPRPEDAAKPGIAFVGDSFTWGFDVERQDRFTERLRPSWPDKRILNLGISGYSTDQEFLLLQQEFEVYRPGVVFLLVCANDRAGNITNKMYGYFKPFFREGAQGSLELAGVPVPQNAMYRYKHAAWPYRPKLILLFLKLMERWAPQPELRTADPTLAIIKNIDSFLKDRGSRLVVALVDADESLKAYCDEQRIDVLDLTEIDSRYRFEHGGAHWNEEGHALAADLISRYLAARPEFFK